MAVASILQAVIDSNGLAGIVGNLVASFLWDAGRWLGKPVLGNRSHLELAAQAQLR